MIDMGIFATDELGIPTSAIVSLLDGTVPGGGGVTNPDVSYYNKIK